MSFCAFKVLQTLHLFHHFILCVLLLELGISIRLNTRNFCSFTFCSSNVNLEFCKSYIYGLAVLMDRLSQSKPHDLKGTNLRCVFLPSATSRGSFCSIQFDPKFDQHILNVKILSFNLLKSTTFFTL